MPALFSDHMVVQRNSTFKVWGHAVPGEDVVVRASWDSKERKAKVLADGNWHVNVPTRSAGGPFTITVQGDHTFKFHDVLIGDVWVCSGQSNMEFTVAQTDHASEDLAKANNKNVRLFHVTKSMKAVPQDDCEGTWNVCSAETVKNFSAAGYFFGNEINLKTKVPIGLIDSTWGGTEAELWTSEQGLLKLPEFAQKIKDKSRTRAEAEKAHTKWEEAVEGLDPGYREWVQPSLNDSGWSHGELQPWSNMEALKNFDGSCWYRAEFDAPAQWAGKPVLLQLGVIDDDETTWVNGVKVGGTQGWNQKRSYTLPTGLVKAGRNIVSVRVWDGAGEGGWTSPERQCVVSYGDSLAQLTKWRYKIGIEKSKLPAEPTLSVVNNSLLFNGMINPLLNYPIKGAIWYQGEANVGRAKQYRTLFPAMISDWRQAWKNQFPFYFVQIAPFSGYGSPAAAELREAQNEAMKLKKTGVAVVTDAVENLADIHPRDKRTVGHRLALWALANDYGMSGIEFSGPLYHSMEVEGGKARVYFGHSKGLASRGGELKEFQIAGSDKVFYPALAKIEGDTVVVWASQVARPAAVRMGWSAGPQPNLFNSSGLPASPFRTDTWPGLTDNAKW